MGVCAAEFKIPILSLDARRMGHPFFLYSHAYFFVGLSAGFSNKS